MPRVTTQPSIIPPIGPEHKRIEEFVGRVATESTTVSIARIICPPGWKGNGQQPEFEETKVILKGMLQIEHRDGLLNVQAGQSVTSHPGEWVRYSSPEGEGAEYIAICTPAFSPQTVHIDATP